MADGFWNSFFAIVVALPALGVGWVSMADNAGDMAERFRDRLSLVARLAVADLSSWIVPLVLLALVARRIGIADRFVHYVVASNWATAIVAWLMLPPSVLLLFDPEAGDIASFLSFGLFIASLVLYWRMTNLSLAKGAAKASGVFAGMVVASLAVLFTLQWLLDLGA